MRFAVLGALEVYRDSEPVPVASGAQMRMLAVLLSRKGRQVPRSELVDALWPEDPPASAVKSIQVQIARLRRALAEPDRITGRGSGYAIRVEPGESDADEFTDLVRRARDIRNSDRPDRFPKALELFDRALGLWRGEPYGTGDGGPVCPPLIPEVRRLTGVRRDVIADRAEVALETGRPAEAIQELTGLLDTEPTNERFAALLMRAYYAAGRQADAQQVYWRTKTRLVDEFGADPTPELQRQYEAMLRGEFDTPTDPRAGTGHARGPATPASAPIERAERPAGGLPGVTPDFTGRERALAELSGRIDAHDPDGTVVAIHAVEGMAGVGKTEFALYAAHRHKDRYPDGGFFVDLHGYTPGVAPVAPETALAELLRQAGVSSRAIPPDPVGRQARWRASMVGRRALIVLDNALDVGQVRPLLPMSAGCLVLITSRRRLNGLAGARPLSLDITER